MNNALDHSDMTENSDEKHCIAEDRKKKACKKNHDSLRSFQEPYRAVERGCLRPGPGIRYKCYSNGPDNR